MFSIVLILRHRFDANVSKRTKASELNRGAGTILGQ